MKPTWPSFDFSAAATPARYEPCSSVNTMEATFLASETESTRPKSTFGYFGAILSTASLYAKPIAMTGL